ncbi:imidazole glycerol phosphate synthase subunit HisH [Candidatus Vidania fulgoroideorum]
MIGIINFGFGNISSVFSCLKRLNCKVKIINKISDYNYCSKIIIPGHGNHYNIFNNLKNIELYLELKNILSKKHFFGICLGKQMFFGYNNESFLNGFNIFNYKVEKFKNETLIGWFKNITKKNFFYEKKYYNFYHSHSYSLLLNKFSSSYFYNKKNYCTSLLIKNFFFTQFHPEKSGKEGFLLFKKFINWQL